MLIPEVEAKLKRCPFLRAPCQGAGCMAWRQVVGQLMQMAMMISLPLGAKN
jgi:hypothetical protein